MDTLTVTHQSQCIGKFHIGIKIITFGKEQKGNKIPFLRSCQLKKVLPLKQFCPSEQNHYKKHKLHVNMPQNNEFPALLHC